MQQLDLFSKLPLLGCIRDRAGRILSVTDRLLALEGATPAQLIGRRVSEVWPETGKDWLQLDRLALQQRKPLVRIEYSRERALWLQSTRIPSRGKVIWVAEDKTAAVKLAAREAWAELPKQPRVKCVPDAEAAVELLLDKELDISALPLRLEEVAGLLVRLAS